MPGDGKQADLHDFLFASTVAFTWRDMASVQDDCRSQQQVSRLERVLGGHKEVLLAEPLTL